MNDEMLPTGSEYGYGLPVAYSSGVSDDGNRDIGEILQAINTGIDDLNLEDVQARKHSFNGHRMCGALFAVLCDLKKRTVISARDDVREAEEPSDSDLLRLDTMLLAEGIVAPEVSSSGIAGVSATTGSPENSIDHADYRTKLDQISKAYREQLTEYEKISNDFRNHVTVLLRQQSSVRPVTFQEVDTMVNMINKKFSHVGVQLKQNTCEAVMMLRSRFLDARRKRRNFSKKASGILNEYFYLHLSNPYPSEEAKEELARRCGITISQVCNWFGNKRIRYKRNIPKAMEEASVYVANTAAAEAASTRETRGSGQRGVASPASSGRYRDVAGSYGMAADENKFTPDYVDCSAGYDLAAEWTQGREVLPEFPPIRASEDSDSDRDTKEKRSRN